MPRGTKKQPSVPPDPEIALSTPIEKCIVDGPQTFRRRPSDIGNPNGQVLFRQHALPIRAMADAASCARG